MLKFIKRIISIFKPDTIEKTIIEPFKGEYLITIEWSSGEVLQYFGSSTVFYYYPEFERCGAGMDGILSSMIKQYEFKNRT